LYRALILSGVAGVGKSTVADAVGGALSAAGFRTAVIDSDALAQFGPPPGEPGFYDRLKCINLAAVWANFRAAGARFVVVSAGVDSASLRAQYADSLTECELQVVRLVATSQTVRRRISDRGDQAKAKRLLETLVEQEAKLDSLALEDFAVANDRPASVVAKEVIARAGWST